MKSSLFSIFTILIFFSHTFAQNIPTNGLISYYPFSGDANDIIGNNNGIIQDAILTNDMCGLSANAFQFDGTGYITLLDNINETDNFAIAAWVFLNSYNTHPYWGIYGGNAIFSKGNLTYSGAWDYIFNVNDLHKLCFVEHYAYCCADNVQSPDDFPIGQWTHVAYVKDNGGGKLYQNGLLVAINNTMRGQNVHDSSPTSIGRLYFSTPQQYSQNWDGFIDEFYIYNSALTDNEVLELYYAGVCNSLPIAQAGEDQTIECSGIEGTNVTLDASSSLDEDGDPLTFTWTLNDEVISTESVTNLSLSVGEYSFTLVVDDGNGGTASDEVLIKVKDTTPPILFTKEPITIWPVNHKYITIGINDMISSINDGCSGEISIDGVVITQVTSDELEDDPGSGDGNTLNDIVISDDCKTIDLRAERLGNGNGRVYTITLAIKDISGNIGSVEFKINVPHDKKKIAIKDETQYLVDGICEVPMPNQQLSKDIFDNNYSITKNIVPSEYILGQNYPNPFNPTTTISYSIPKDEYVTLTIYDVLGNTVSVLVNGNKSAGTYSYSFEASNLTSGLYFYTLKAGNFTLTKKMLLLK